MKKKFFIRRVPIVDGPCVSDERSFSFLLIRALLCFFFGFAREIERKRKERKERKMKILFVLWFFVFVCLCGSDVGGRSRDERPRRGG